VDGIDAALGRVIDLEDRCVELEGATIKSNFHLRREVQRRNRDLDRLAFPAGLLRGLANDVGIIHRPQKRIITSGKHLIDFGVQLPRNLFAVSCKQMLPLGLGNVVAVQDAVWIVCELST